jgi:hypothetical protein
MYTKYTQIDMDNPDRKGNPNRMNNPNRRDNHNPLTPTNETVLNSAHTKN